MTSFLIRFLCITMIAASLPVSASEQARGQETITTAQPEAAMNITFETREDKSRWLAVNDGVMGGKSSGGPSFEDGHLIFSGVINTDGGGFSSIRMRAPDGALSEADGLWFRVKSDGRAYELNLRTNVTYWGRSVAYRAPIAPAPAGQWSEVFVPFAELEPSVFGRRVRAAAFDPSEVRIIGVILADGQDGAFRLEISRIWAGKASS